MRRHPFLISSVLALALASCVDEPLLPCGDEGCQVDGVELALALDVEWTEDQPFDELAGEHVVTPGDTIHVRYTVTNRGTAVSGATGIYWFIRDRMRMPVPVLYPGDSHDGLVAVVVDGSVGLYRDRFFAAAELTVDSAGNDWSFRDDNLRDNQAQLDIRVAQPALRVSVGIGDTLRIPSEVAVTVTNISTVPSTPYTLGFCFDYDICNRDRVWFDLRAMPSLAPGETFVGSVPVTVPPELSVPAAAFEGRVFACVALGHGIELPPTRQNSTCSSGWWSVILRE